MSYESRLYVVEKAALIDDNMRYGKVIASFNMGCIDRIYKEISGYSFTDTYIYSDDGNTRIVTDCYGERLREIPLCDMVMLLSEERYGNENNYRRLYPCIQFLSALVNSPHWNNLVVLHYGY